MELYKFKAEGKNGKMYTNLVLTWSYKGKLWHVYMRPSFFKDVRLVLAKATQVNSFDDCKQVLLRTNIRTRVRVHLFPCIQCTKQV